MAKVERLRVGLVAGTVLLVAVLVGSIGYSRYRAAKGWLNRVKQQTGANLVRETDGFTYSQSVQGKTVFTLHAAKAYQHENGLWTLHDVVITLYGLRPDRADRIYGKDFEWDENKGIARAVGDVEMDLQVPEGLAQAERGGGPGAVGSGVGRGDAATIHVRTSGLVFLRKLDVAATSELIEFRYGSMVCTGKGAEFDSSPNALHLLADVHAQGTMRGRPVSLAAGKADFERTSNLLTLTTPVVRMGAKTAGTEAMAKAAGAVLHLRRDGSVEQTEATGGVLLEQGTRHVAAARLDAVLGERNQPQTARLSGGVRMVDDDARRPATGEAGEVRLKFGGTGTVEQVDAVGGAHVQMSEVHFSDGSGFVPEREMRGTRWRQRLLRGGRVERNSGRST